VHALLDSCLASAREVLPVLPSTISEASAGERPALALPSARLCNNATVASDRACVAIVYPPTELWARPGRTQPEAERQDPGPGRAAARPVRAGPETYSYFARSGSGPCHTLGTN